MTTAGSGAKSSAEKSPEELGGLAFETLLLELFVKFLNLAPGDVDREIEEAQRRICESIDVDLSALWQWNGTDPSSMTMTHLYRPLGGPPVPDRMNAMEFWPWCMGHITEGKKVVVSSRDRLPPEAATDREMWIQFGVLSSLCFPLSVGGGPSIGALSFNTQRAERDWPDLLVRRLAIVAQVFAISLARKHSDHALRESEGHLALAASSAGAGLWSLDLDSREYWFTPRILEMLGLPENETLNLDRFLGLVHPDDRGPVQRKISDVTQSGDEGEAEYRIVRPDGAVRWIASWGRIHCASEGTPSHLMGCSVDISERKQLEGLARNLTGRIIVAHEEERARLARELHDDITQRAACMAVDVAGIEKLPAAEPIRESLNQVRRDLIRMGEDVHALSYRLHPAVLAELGLIEAIRAECERFQKQQTLSVRLALESIPESTPDDVSLCLFRVSQEALRNTARHADAGQIEISIRERDEGLELLVQDDGRGFDVESLTTLRTLGLSGMRERVRHLGGRFEVDSALRQGTTVRTWLPLVRRPS